MKLTFEHLTPYLLYRLKFQCKRENMEIDICELTIKQLLLWNENYHFDFKPILKPLSDLTKEIEHNISYLDIIHMKIFDSEFVDEDNTIQKFWYEIVNGLIKMTIQQSEKLMKYLYKNHFDVEGIFNNGKGLIENNLAIDINTLNK